MSEEEKKAIEILSSWYNYNKKNRNKLLEADKIIKVQETILNLIENQQKEMENLKEIEKSHQEENGKLRVELEQEKEKNKELEEHQKQYLDGELITANQGKFFEKMIKENYISKEKIKDFVSKKMKYLYVDSCAEDSGKYTAYKNILNLLEE